MSDLRIPQGFFFFLDNEGVRISLRAPQLIFGCHNTLLTVDIRYDARLEPGTSILKNRDSSIRASSLGSTMGFCKGN